MQIKKITADLYSWLIGIAICCGTFIVYGVPLKQTPQENKQFYAVKKHILNLSERKHFQKQGNSKSTESSEEEATDNICNDFILSIFVRLYFLRGGIK